MLVSTIWQSSVHNAYSIGFHIINISSIFRQPDIAEKKGKNEGTYILETTQDEAPYYTRFFDKCEP